MNNTYVTAAAYSYDAQGNRIRKDQGNFGSGQFTEYVWANGQVLSEKDQSGLWTDYIYANGKKIARTPSQDLAIHLHGDNSIAYKATAWINSPISYVVKPGDKISWKQYQQGAARGGIGMYFVNGPATNWSTTDTDGEVMNSDSRMDQLH